MNQKLCPVCHSFPIALPNGVCMKCYEHLKRDEVPAGQQVKTDKTNCIQQSSADIKNDVFENNMDRSMMFQLEQWDLMTKGGLKAAVLAVIVVDEAKHLPTWNEWHLRRIQFISDLIDLLPEALFTPITRKQMNVYKNKAILYWSGKLSEAERLDIYNDFKQQLDKKTDPSTWDGKSLPLWMMQIPDSFDWMWEQFMDCIYECVPKEHDLSDDDWLKLFHKHFSDILSQWVALS